MGRSPNERIDRAARRLIRKRVKSLRRDLEALDAALAHGKESVEPVHDARVSARRLRSALDVVEPVVPPKKFKRWMRALRRLIHGLGEARDLDVQLEFVAKQAADCEDKRRRPGLERLRLRLAQHRMRSEKKVSKLLAKSREKRTLAALSEWLDEHAHKTAPVVAGITSIDVNSTAQDSMADRITHRLRDRLGELLAFDEAVYVPGQVQKLHDMRIAVKRLRYTLELVKPFADGRFDEVHESSSELQDLLGDLHDCDVWIAFLPVFLEKETRRTAEYFGRTTAMSRVRPGINWLLQNRTQARQRVYRRLLEFWHQAMREQVWSRALDRSRA